MVCGFSANADFDEGDLVERRRTVTQPLHLAIPLLLALLALMLVESLYANRFDRQDETQRQPAE